VYEIMMSEEVVVGQGMVKNSVYHLSKYNLVF
jgi:hypothetical protein